MREFSFWTGAIGVGRQGDSGWLIGRSSLRISRRATSNTLSVVTMEPVDAATEEACSAIEWISAPLMFS